MIEERRNLLNKMEADAAKKGLVSMASGYGIKKRDAGPCGYNKRSIVCCKKNGLTVPIKCAAQHSKTKHKV